MSLRTRLFPQLDGKWATVNLNQRYRYLHPQREGKSLAIDPVWCSNMVQLLHAELGVVYSFGGWLEDRRNLWAGHYHKPDAMLHLGVDYNVSTGTAVSLPCDGRLILAEHDNDQDGGWGGRAIYQMRDLYVIFAHLGIVYGRVGSHRRQGEVIGVIGPSEANGGWYPHLHVQCMREYQPGVDGYCKWYASVEDDFPDPESVLNSP